MPQLSPDQRYTIETLKTLKHSVTEISAYTGILPCTISRELSRNSVKGRYKADQAGKMADARRKRGAYKLRGAVLQTVEKMLEERHSPEQISGRLAQQKQAVVSHETIYTHIYRDKKLGGCLYKCLRRGHKKRRKRLGKYDKRGLIPNKTMISERPEVVAQRQRLGDWEGDTIIGAGHQGVMVTLVERKSKYTLMGKAENKSAAAVEKVVVELLKNTPLPKETITFDNGTEFANHQKIAEQLTMKVYFANPYHSWERGVNENTNGLIRQFMPKKSNLKEFDQNFVQAVQDNLNNRPRKSLGFLSPLEFFNNASMNPNSVAFET